MTEAGKDVGPFLENSSEVQFVNKETVVKLLTSGGPVRKGH
jgi:hypothetical protein